jgi:DNA invertase Pin-like site-specific DNA recombinase
VELVERLYRYRADAVALPQDRGHARTALARPRESDALIVAKLARLSRSLLQFVDLLERSNKGRWNLIALDLGIDTSTPSGEMVANVLMSFAQFERRLIGQRTKDALAVKRARGERLGRPKQVPDDLVTRIINLWNQDVSYGRIARQLNGEGVPTVHGGGEWHPSTVRAIVISNTDN